MVSFRLTAAEYDTFQAACAAAAATSISDFARKAMHQWVAHTASAARDTEMKRLQDRVQSLAVEVKQLAEIALCQPNDRRLVTIRRADHEPVS